MKMTMEKAVNMFHTVKAVNYNEVKLDQISLIWLRLYPFAKEWEDVSAAVKKDIEEARKPFDEEFGKLSEEERNGAKGNELNAKWREKLDSIPSVKAQPELLKKEIEVELPTITEDEFLKIAKSSAFKSIGEAGIFFDLVAK